MNITPTAAAVLLSVSLGTTTPAAQESTFRVVVALKEPMDHPFANRQQAIAAAQDRVSASLTRERGLVTKRFEGIPVLLAVVTREGWTQLAVQPDVGRVDLDEAATLESVKARIPGRPVKIERMGRTGRGVTIALIDSGVDSTHPDLAGAIVDEACFCVSAQGEPCCPNGSREDFGIRAAWDDNGHGTHLAGIIAGRGRVSPKGIAPGAYLVVVKIADKMGATSTGSMLSALDWLSRVHPEVNIVNLSLGTDTTFAGSCDQASPINTWLADAGLALRKNGAVLVAAAGNGGSTNTMAAPSCVTGYVAVGAVYGQSSGRNRSFGCTDETVAKDRVTCFSNSSSALALLAPGVGITSTGIGGRLATGSGTSQAAAVVSGAVALLMERAPGRGEEVTVALRAHGISVTDARNGRSTPRLNVRAAVNALGDTQ